MANELNFYSTNFCQSRFTDNVLILVYVYNIAQYVYGFKKMTSFND